MYKIFVQFKLFICIYKFLFNKHTFYLYFAKCHSLRFHMKSNIELYNFIFELNIANTFSMRLRSFFYYRSDKSFARNSQDV